MKGDSLSSPAQDDATPEVNKVEGQIKAKAEKRQRDDKAEEGMHGQDEMVKQMQDENEGGTRGSDKTETKLVQVKTETKSVKDGMNDAAQGNEMAVEPGQVQNTSETEAKQVHDHTKETELVQIETETKNVQYNMKDVAKGKEKTTGPEQVQNTDDREAGQVHDHTNEAKPVEGNNNTNDLLQANEWNGEDVQEGRHKTINLEPLQDINEVKELMNGMNGEVAKNQQAYNNHGILNGMGDISRAIEKETIGDRSEVTHDIGEVRNAENIIPEVNPFHFNPRLLYGHARENERENLQENDKIKNTEEMKDRESDKGFLNVEEYNPEANPKRKITLGDLNIDMSKLEYGTHARGQAEGGNDKTDDIEDAVEYSQQSCNKHNDPKQNETTRDVKPEEKGDVQRKTEDQTNHTASDARQSHAKYEPQPLHSEINQKVTRETNKSDENCARLKENDNARGNPGNQNYSEDTTDEKQKPENHNNSEHTADEKQKPGNQVYSKDAADMKQKLENQSYSKHIADEDKKPENQDCSKDIKDMKQKPGNQNIREDTADMKQNLVTADEKHQPDYQQSHNGHTANSKPDKVDTTTTTATRTTTTTTTATRCRPKGNRIKNRKNVSENLLGIDYEVLIHLLPHMSLSVLPKALRQQNSPNKTRDNFTNSSDGDQSQSKNSLNVIQESSEDERDDGSDNEIPARRLPPNLAFLRRHSFHHFPVPPVESTSKKAEKARALLQAVEEEELEKISKRLGDKTDLVRQHLGHVENRLFEMFGDKEKQTININKFLMGLTATGMRPTDPRLKQTRDNIKKLQDNLGTEFVTLEVDYDTFMSIISENLEVVVRAFSASFVIPDFQGFCKQIEDLYNICYVNHSGRSAQYIPQLARFHSKYWGVSVCTVDGQRFSLGDVDVPFTIQSCSYALMYAVAVGLLRTEKVHYYVGMEPSGRYHNELCLDYNNKPHNPMINSGAIMTAAIIKPELSAADRFDYMFKVYKRLAGDEYLGFNNSVFLSEKECADRNFALAYFMRENKCFPQNHKLHESLDFYFQLCSMEITAESGAVMAATLANGGLNPLTGDPVLTVDAVRNTLTLMHSCGMYNYSGQFAFQVGLPAKSGVSGCVLLVVPNTMGICLWSPPLDSNGNSCRGVQFCMEMVSRFNFHNFDNLRGYAKSKQDPRTAKTESKAQILFDLLFSAAAGDVSALRRHSLAGTDMEAKDYDGRTALHVATSEGHDEVVDFLLNRCNVYPLPKDRWDRTPLDDAESFDHPKCSKLITDSCKRKDIELPISYKDFVALSSQSNEPQVTTKSS